MHNLSLDFFWVPLYLDHLFFYFAIGKEIPRQTVVWDNVHNTIDIYNTYLGLKRS